MRLSDRPSSPFSCFTLIPAVGGMKQEAFVQLLFFFFVFCISLQSTAVLASGKQSYVAYLGLHPHSAVAGELELSEAAAVYEAATESHYDLLGSVMGDKGRAKESMIYSYTRHINGFAAILDEEEALELQRQPGVLSVFPNRAHELHTTRSWQFLGLATAGGEASPAWAAAGFGEGTIIGNLDTGVWPESESFSDAGFGAIPPNWKGICQNDVDKSFSCNRKLIGARYFNKGYAAAAPAPLNDTYNTPRDLDGHGTHTLSTAGGVPVPRASVFGYGNGTASGGSPRARVAAYKVCYPAFTNTSGECYDADILAAFDAAIHDGVGVLSVSLGGEPTGYFADGIAIGSFHAVMSGIVVVCSAGNSGPKPSTVSNVAPWILTVAASSIDRKFPSLLHFGSVTVKGQSLSQAELPAGKHYPMVTSIAAKAANASEADANLCMRGSLEPAKAKGKIVVCRRGINPRVEKGEVVKEAGGVGMVLANDNSTGNEVIADVHVLPATHISYSDSLAVYSYINSTNSPVSTISAPSTLLGTHPAPFMAAFSSRGPNPVTPEILKPDITAPGISIIAAYSLAVAPSGLAADPRRIPFNSVSGTSMSCPHVSGVAGLLRTLHPEWSPAMIKSAMMTSAVTRDNSREPVLDSAFAPATPYNYGAGHIHPTAAFDPGLVYDVSTADYLGFLCSLGYNATQLASFLPEYRCPPEPPRIENLNYPTITVLNLTCTPVTVTRRVKNVGKPGTYAAHVSSPKGTRATVAPSQLTFTEVGEEKTFAVTIVAKHGDAAAAGGNSSSFGVLQWSDGERRVRSTMAVTFSSS